MVASKSQGWVWTLDPLVKTFHDLSLSWRLGPHEAKARERQKLDEEKRRRMSGQRWRPEGLGAGKLSGGAQELMAWVGTLAA